MALTLSVQKSKEVFNKTEKEIKPQKISLNENNETVATKKEIKELEEKVKILRNELKVFKNNGLVELLNQKQKELDNLEAELKEKRKGQGNYKGNILVRLDEEKHQLYKSFVVENKIKFNQFVLLSMAYTYKQAKEGKIKITDYGIEPVPFA